MSVAASPEPLAPEAPAERPMRILAVTPDLNTGGAERHLATTLPELDPARFDVRVCCIKGRGQFYDVLERTHVAVESLDIGDADVRAPVALGALVRRMRRMRPDVVMTRGFAADVLGRIAARIAGVPAVVTWKHNCGHLGREGRRDRAAELLLRSLTTRYFAVCNAQIPYLTGYLGLPPEKVLVVYNSVDARQYVPVRERSAAAARSVGIGPDDVVVGMTSVLREEKDHAMMLRALPRVVAAIPNAKLLLIGDGPLRNELDQLANELDVRDSVRFAGHRDDVAELLSLVDVAALTSFTIECFPYSILESMGRAIPAVCTAVGGLPELVEHGETGFLVPAHAPQQLAARLIELLADPQLRRKMGDAARLRLEQRFSLDRSIEALSAALEGAVENARPAALR